jgi:hypothetical protein
MIASSESGHHLGDLGTYVPVEEPSTASRGDITMDNWRRRSTPITG